MTLIQIVKSSSFKSTIFWKYNPFFKDESVGPGIYLSDKALALHVWGPDFLSLSILSSTYLTKHLNIINLLYH